MLINIYKLIRNKNLIIISDSYIICYLKEKNKKYSIVFRFK